MICRVTSHNARTCFGARAIQACLIVFLILGADISRSAPAPEMAAVPRAKLCITEGALEERKDKDTLLAVNVPKMRAVVAAKTDQAAEARLTYLGPTSSGVPLGSGQMRRQFALKLRAQDACNLVYASWRIEPKSELVVSIKSNPGQHTSAECGNHGYRNIKPAKSGALPKLKSGEAHSLFAEMNGSELRVSVDNTVVWEGDLGHDVLKLDGPVGVRTDNGRFEFEFLTGEIGAPRACKPGDSD